MLYHFFYALTFCLAILTGTITPPPSAAASTFPLSTQVLPLTDLSTPKCDGQDPLDSLSAPERVAWECYCRFAQELYHSLYSDYKSFALFHERYHLDILKALKDIEQHYPSWKATAQANRTPPKKLTAISPIPTSQAQVGKPTLWMKTDGTLLALNLETPLGVGSSHTVYRVLALRIQPDVTDPEKSWLETQAQVLHLFNSWEGVTHKEREEAESTETEIYQLIEQLYQTLPAEEQAHFKLARAEQLTTPQGQLGFLQERYAGTLLMLLKQETSAKQELGALNLLEDIAQGLQSFHQIGWVHGDLKRDNILLNLNPLQAILSDYSIAFDPLQSVQPRSTAECESPEMAPPRALPRYGATAAERINFYQKRDLYAFGLLSLKFLPGFGQASPWDRCKNNWDYKRGYSAWGSFGRCLKEQAVIVFQELTANTEALCATPGPLSDLFTQVPASPRCLLYQAITSCMNPDPLERPSAAQLTTALRTIRATERSETERVTKNVTATKNETAGAQATTNPGEPTPPTSPAPS